jgi:O-antigen ligase
MTLWESALRANENSWLGVGTGDYEKVLNEYYQKNNMGHFAKSNLNAHNQYIQLLFSNGIFGLIAFLIMLLRPLYFSVKHQDLFGVLIFFPFILYGITEVFLGRYQGVIFFALVHQSLVCYYAGLAKSDKVDNLQASIN